MAYLTGDTVAQERETLRGTVCIEHEVKETTALRAAAAHPAGRPTGPEGGVGTMFNAELNQRRSEIAVDTAGRSGVAWTPGDPLAEARAHAFPRARANTIEGGSPDVPRSQLGERMLNLPRGPEVGGGVAWSKTRR